MEPAITMPDREALKAKYLDCFAARARSSQTLLEVIKRLLRLGVVLRPLGGVPGVVPAPQLLTTTGDDYDKRLSEDWEARIRGQSAAAAMD
jgi:hypothetical protein